MTSDVSTPGRHRARPEAVPVEEVLVICRREQRTPPPDNVIQLNSRRTS